MLTFISGNTNKVRECERLLGATLAYESLPLDEIQSIDSLPVVEHKARLAYAALKRPVLVEDTGLAFAAWTGLPGALIKWFLNSLGTEGLCRLMRAETNRAATAATLLGYCDGESVRTFAGTVQGSIPDYPRGTDGFGWDAIFQPEASVLTFAEMSAAEKDRFSMRRKALEAFRVSGLLDG
ncbi:MAG: non-canonical purine NTP pyrophosphatase [Desulfurellaceae bacterium]|nr:non-canonical purine NTP pyrophosphatase [Desulfurellaceae bacterium]